MIILYPSDPLLYHTPDSFYEEEYEVISATGLQPALFSFEEFLAGRLQLYPRNLDLSGASVLYRGWMLSAEQYRRLYAMLSSYGLTMTTSPESYLRTHHLPGWYSILQDWTPETMILESERDLSTALQKASWDSFFVKDYVKSNTGTLGSQGKRLNEIAAIIEELRQYRGELEGGICLRRFEEFVPGSEQRFFVAQGKAFEYQASFPSFLNECLQRIDSPFFSVDIARRTDGTDRIIEIGDGQVSDRKEWPVKEFVDILLHLHTTNISE